MPKFWQQKKEENFFLILITHTHNKKVLHKENVFRVPVFYSMHVIFLGRVAKGTWKSKTGNHLR